MIKIRSISTSVLFTLLICGGGIVLVPFCFSLVAPTEPLDTSEKIVVVAIVVAFLVGTALLVLLYALFHYMKYAEISASEVRLKIPARKDVKIPTDELTAFGLVHFEPRNTKLFFCKASKEDVIAFYMAHLDESKRLFRNWHFQEQCMTPERIWKMAVGIYAYYRQEGMYFLECGNVKNAVCIEEVLGMPAQIIDIAVHA